jgi:hypothetical protein
MDLPIDLDRTPKSTAPFAAYDSSPVESWPDADVENASIYQEIADRRAQLECAETLRRVRAL